MGDQGGFLVIEQKIFQRRETKQRGLIKVLRYYISKEKKSNEDILVEKTINKWFNLQKTIKEELTLEDVIIKQKLENLIIFFCAILSNIK